jgi:hypothetical protein
MKLDPRTSPEWETGEPIYTVTVTNTGIYNLPVRCEGRSVREAYEEANAYIWSVISQLCAGCAQPVSESNETFRNCGYCDDCYQEKKSK